MIGTDSLRAGLSQQKFKFVDLFFADLNGSDVKARHLMTIPVRVSLFVASWILLLVFTPHVWSQAPLVPLLINIGFLITTLCHYVVLRWNHLSLSVVVLEIVADVLCQTGLIYLMGINTFAPFLVYGLYLTAVGILTGYHLTLLASLIALLFYDAVFLLIETGLVKPFNGGAQARYLLTYFPYLNLFLLPAVLILVIYTIRVAYHFSSLKERSLERKNQQLAALQKMSETIRKIVEPDLVMDQVLKGVMTGLGFDLCFLAIKPDESSSSLRLHFPFGHKRTADLLREIGILTDRIFLPLDSPGSVAQSLRSNKVLVRNNLGDMLIGLTPEVDGIMATRAQKMLKIRKWVITPLIVEKQIIGALVGGSAKDFIEEDSVDLLEHFSNQAAMAIENARLMSAMGVKNKELENLSRVKSEFLAIMSHELRTPLNAVIGYTEALMDQVLGPINADQNRSLEDVLLNGKRLLDLINNTLDLAKLESGRMALNIEAFDLFDLASEVCSTLQALARRKQINLEVVCKKRLPILNADLIKVRQILVNLVGNALKFTPQSGSIHVSLEHYESASPDLFLNYQPAKLIRELSEDPLFVIRVSDSGIGIPETEISGIFDLFSQADSTATRRHEGTGLGLSLSKQFAQLHSGLILVKSQVGQGSEFCLLLPQMVAQAS